MIIETIKMKKNLFFLVAYNHENFIESVVKRIPDSLMSDPANEVLIFDDASKDDTFNKSRSLKALIPPNGAKLTVMKNPVNQGYGGNQKLGYRYAINQGYQRVFLIHGDGQYAPECLPDLISRYERDSTAEAVFGTRMSNWKSPLKGGMPVYKFVGNKILTWIQNWILASKMSEFHSGMRSYATSLLRRIPFECNSNDYHFDTEIIIQCVAAKSHPVEVPIPTHYGDEDCNVNGMKYAKDILLACFHFRVFRAGFLYDPKFDISHTTYTQLASGSIHRKLIEEVPEGSKVLLVGAKEPLIIKELTQRACQCDELCLLETQSLTGPFRSLTPTGLDQKLSELQRLMGQNQYEYILLPQTLEHFSSPESILTIIRNSYPSEMRPIVIATASNVGYIVVRLMLLFGQFNYGTGGILDRNHSRLFSKATFTKLFSQYSFEIKKFSGASLPSITIEEVLPTLGLLAKLSNGLLGFAAKIWPSLFAYKMLLKAQPLPSVDQLLEDAKNHSEELSRGEQHNLSNSKQITPHLT
ncbi:glycosyltransferase family 2 protein [bacterium]|nr:glycosyltransferase family 2 protein [bacterium]